MLSIIVINVLIVFICDTSNGETSYDYDDPVILSSGSWSSPPPPEKLQVQVEPNCDTVHSPATDDVIPLIVTVSWELQQSAEAEGIYNQL